MSALRFELAAAGDDAELRRRMASDWIAGRITISFRREPSYFAATCLHGDRVETLACRETASGAIIAMGCRASNLAYVNGAPLRIGYLADLRCDAAYRRGTVLARGYRYLHELHRRDPLPFYTTVIYEGNTVAMKTLVGARAGLPDYRDCGRLLTPAIRLDRARAARCPADIAVRRGDANMIPDIFAFLNRRMATRQFAPVYRAADCTGGRLAALAPGDFLVASRRGRIMGTIALWDQSAIRQTHVERYSGVLKVLRPLYNGWAYVRGAHPLPRPGERLRYVYFACFVVEDDDRAVARALLEAAYRAAREGAWQFAIAGLHERDPLAALLDEYPRIEAAGRLFVVSFPDDAPPMPALDDRTPYLEAGCL